VEAVEQDCNLFERNKKRKDIDRQDFKETVSFFSIKNRSLLFTIA